MEASPPPAAPSRQTLARYRQRYEDALFDDVLPFWERHAPDEEHGGFFTALDHDGAVYDTTKHVWMLGRLTWTFATLYREADARPAWLEMARTGMDFLHRHARRPDGRVYYAVTASGRPVAFEKERVFSECFYLMAQAAVARATEDAEALGAAQNAFERLWKQAFDEDGDDGTLPGQSPTQALATPMILLNTLEEVAGEDWPAYTREAEQTIARLLQHVHRPTETVRETVAPGGELVSGPAGRLLNPGHGIEAGWFVRHWAERLARPDLTRTADDMVRWSFARGWDDADGGLFCFLDAEGFSPAPVHWSAKLWWPCCEALYAHLLRYARTGDADAWQAFTQTDDYTFAHFPDEAHGEWFGYLDRGGQVTHRFKGSEKKGCFHLPRTLWRCVRLLTALEENAPA